jgi:hypothetical protein
VCFLKDFDIKAVVGNSSFDDTFEDDTVYTNTVDEISITELSEISMRINTYDNKKPSYSAVGVKNGSSYRYLDTLYSNYVYINEDERLMRAEEALVVRIQNQYKTPSLKVTANLKNTFTPLLPIKSTYYGKTFVVDYMNFDYKQCSVETTLIEKK